MYRVCSSQLGIYSETLSQNKNILTYAEKEGRKIGAGEMAQGLRAWAVFPEGLGLSLSTHLAVHNHL